MTTQIMNKSTDITKQFMKYNIKPVIERFKLSENTKKHLKELIPNFGFNGLGELVFRRTYSRNNEDWSDVVIRVIEGCMSIRKDHYYKNSLEWNDDEWEDFANKMALSLFKMEWLPPGRGLWMMGTDYTYERGSIALYNCFRVDTKFWTNQGLKSFEDFEDGNNVVVRGKYKWINATVKCFGEQELWKLTVEKYFVRDVIYTTRSHRWLAKLKDVDNFEIMTTDKLQENWELQTINLQKNLFDTNWFVVDVEPTGFIEPVWCVVEPEFEEFTLESGILTKNCAATDTTEDVVHSAEWAMDCLMNGCVPPDTNILTDQGIKEIKNIKIGDKVWSYNLENKQKELKSVLYLHNPVVKQNENICIIGKYGSITTSKKHPLLVYANNEWNYKLTGNIREGDILKKFNYDRNVINFNKKAWFVGSFLGDGYSNLTKYKVRKISISSDNEEFIKYFANTLAVLSEKQVIYDFDYSKKYKVNMWKVEKTLNKLNILSLNWENIVGELYNIPEWIKNTSDSNIFFSFLCGLIDTKGTILDSKINISIPSIILAKSLILYSRLFGLECLLKEYDATYNVIYSCHYFQEYLSFCKNLDKREKIFEFLNNASIDNQILEKNDIVCSIKENLEIDENWKDITVEDNNNYYCGKESLYCSHNCGVGFNTMWRGEISKPDKELKELYVIDDSREGWVTSLIKLMCAYIYSPKYGKNKFPTFDYSKIRAKGLPIKSFGGTASGPEPLKQMHKRIEGYLDALCDGRLKCKSKTYKEVNPGDWQEVEIDVDKPYSHTRFIADVFNAIGACVVAG